MDVDVKQEITISPADASHDILIPTPF